MTGNGQPNCSHPQQSPASWTDQFTAACGAYIARYHRHEIQLDAALPDEPALIVGNHGFGGIVDLNVLAMSRTLRGLTDRPQLWLVHQLAWSLGAGRLVEAFGCKPASGVHASDGFASGKHVIVFPGGDVDASKPWNRRNQIDFGGRTGFARLAAQHGVPLVPVVTVGAGESLLVLSDGQALAKMLGLARFRVKAIPISLSAPWGLSVGMAGLLPYLPLPTKLVTAVLPPMRPRQDECHKDFGERVRSAMQSRADELVAGRTPLLG